MAIQRRPPNVPPTSAADKLRTLKSLTHVNRRFPILLRHVTYNLRGGFLVRPMAIALTLGAAGLAGPRLESAFPGFGDWAPSLFPSHTDPVVAQVILAGIAASTMTVVSIVFAILL